MNKKSKKVIHKKAQAQVKKKVEVKKIEVAAQKSISKLVFNFITTEKLLECDNRKEKFNELLVLVKKEFPNSKFQRTHFFWYISRAKKQLAHNLPLTHLVTIKKD